MEDGEEVDLDHELFDNDAIEESITRIDDKKRIIMDVKNNPCLWNTETSEYNQKSKRNSALTAIATTRNTGRSDQETDAQPPYVYDPRNKARNERYQISVKVAIIFLYGIH